MKSSNHLIRFKTYLSPCFQKASLIGWYPCLPGLYDAPFSLDPASGLASFLLKKNGLIFGFSFFSSVSMLVSMSFFCSVFTGLGDFISVLTAAGDLLFFGDFVAFFLSADFGDFVFGFSVFLGVAFSFGDTFSSFTTSLLNERFFGGDLWILFYERKKLGYTTLPVEQIN